MTMTATTPTPTTSRDALLDALVQRYPAPPLHRAPTDWELACWDLVHGGVPPVGTPHGVLRATVRELWARGAAGLITAAAIATPLVLARFAAAN